jgi:hypothetical protein
LILIFLFTVPTSIKGPNIGMPGKGKENWSLFIVIALTKCGCVSMEASLTVKCGIFAPKHQKYEYSLQNIREMFGYIGFVDKECNCSVDLEKLIKTSGLETKIDLKGVMGVWHGVSTDSLKCR